jgi:Winged helix-turn helix
MPKILYPQVNPGRSERVGEARKAPSLHPPVPTREAAKRLLKSGECSNLAEAADALGYSWRQCQRWFASYREGGLQELLKSRVDERGRQELVTPEAFEELKEAMKRGEIATIGQAHEFLSEREASSTLILTASVNSSDDAR